LFPRNVEVANRASAPISVLAPPPVDESTRQRSVTLRPGFCVEDADVVIGLASRQLETATERDRDVVSGHTLDESDPAAEKRTDIGRVRKTGNIEDARALEEERAFLRKEQREARQVHLTDVGFCFGKVRVDGDRRIQIRRDVLEDVDAAGQLAATVPFSAGQIRPNVQPPPLPDAVKTFKAARLREVPDPDVLARRRPSIDFLTTFDLPFDVEAPDRLPRLEAEGLERDLDLGHPSVAGDSRSRVPDAVPVAAERLAVVGHLAVRSRTGGIHLEEEAVAVIKERIEDDRDSIVDVEIRVARELRGDDPASRSITADDPDVQRVIGVQHANGGLLRWFSVFDRFTLPQRADWIRGLPGGLVQPTVDADSPGRPAGSRDRRVAARTAWLPGGGRRAVEQRDSGEERHQAHATDLDRHHRRQRAS